MGTWYGLNFEKRIDSRWVTIDHIVPLLQNLSPPFEVFKIGESFQKRPIYKFQLGTGPIKILIWTQMHGNESTGTKAVLDMIRFFQEPGPFDWLAHLILKSCTIHCIPILNPDGAQAYTRKNAQQIDLNRDVIDKKGSESILLQKVLKQVNPAFCFNLHDQRTLFSVGAAHHPATISFLAPSVDEARTVTSGRKQTMEVIVAMNHLLQKLISNRVGRYTDEFYPTATGDNFQKMGHNTILIESGHAYGDYLRKESRKSTFLAILEGLRYISQQEKEYDYQSYFNIPNNEKNYTDIIVRNVSVAGKKMDLSILFVEKLIDGKVSFVPTLDKKKPLLECNADKIIDGAGITFANANDAKKWIENSFN